MISIQKTADVFDQSIGTLDLNLNRVLKKHEFEYLQAYNVYVKNKEGELMRAIYQMNERNSSSRIKDFKIQQLEE
jgi:virulence-associated protein VapD